MESKDVDVVRTSAHRFAHLTFRRRLTLKDRRSVHVDQRGITLIEILVVVAIIGLISFGLTSTISQTFNVSSRTSNRMIAVRQVQQAGKQVSNDVLQSQNVTPTSNDTGFPLTLVWEHWDRAERHEVRYDLTENNALKRTLWVTPLGEGTTETVTIVARYIDDTYDYSDDEWRTYCEWDPLLRVLTFKVTARVAAGPQGASETRIYEIKTRPG